MHDDQLHIDAAMVRELIAAQFPRYAGEAVVQLPRLGTVNAIFRVGESVTARFPLQPQDPRQAAERLAAEAAAADAFAEHAGVLAPRPLGLGVPGRRYPMPWTLQNWVDGAVATPDGLAASDDFAADIARLIAKLRDVDVRGRPFDGAGRGGDLKAHDSWMATCFANNGDIDGLPRLRTLWAEWRELPASGANRMSHKDLIPANLLVRDGRLVGVLDTGGFGPADPALDLVVAWHLFDRDRRSLIREYLGSDEVEWQRGAAWAFIQAMGLPWYYRTSNPQMAALGRSTLARLAREG